MKFKRGSIVKRRLGGVKGAIIFHTGIYLDDHNIIHFNGVEKGDRDSVIQRVMLSDFAKGKRVTLQKSPENEAHGRSVCRKALEYLADKKNGFDNNYSFFTNNCQSFTCSCFEAEYGSVEIKTGKPPVSQVKKAISFAVSAVGLLAFFATKNNRRTKGKNNHRDRQAA